MVPVRDLVKIGSRDDIELEGVRCSADYGFVVLFLLECQLHKIVGHSPDYGFDLETGDHGYLSTRLFLPGYLVMA